MGWESDETSAQPDVAKARATQKGARLPRPEKDCVVVERALGDGTPRERVQRVVLENHEASVVWTQLANGDPKNGLALGRVHVMKNAGHDQKSEVPIGQFGDVGAKTGSGRAVARCGDASQRGIVTVHVGKAGAKLFGERADSAAVIEDRPIESGPDESLDAAQLVPCEIDGRLAGYGDVLPMKDGVFFRVRVEFGSIIRGVRRLRGHCWAQHSTLHPRP